MGMKKAGSTTTAPVAETPANSQASVDSGTAAAVSRLKKSTETSAAKTESNTSHGKYVGRDFDKEARGKSLCLLYGHAIGSALIAGTKFDDLNGAFQNMKFFVDAAMKEIFPE